MHQLEKELLAESRTKSNDVEKFNPWSWKDVKELKTVQKIQRMGLPIWQEMLVRPILQDVAYLCIADDAKQYITEAAFSLCIVNGSVSPSIFYISDVGRHLQTLTPGRSELNAFSWAMSHYFTEEQRYSVGFVLSELPEAFLEKWLKHDRMMLVPPSSEAMVIVALLTSQRARKKKNRELLLQKLLKYAAIPGFPRFAYLASAPLDDKNILPVLRALINDDSVSDLEFSVAADRHAQLIREKGADLLDIQGEVAERRRDFLKDRVFKKSE